MLDPEDVTELVQEDALEDAPLANRPRFFMHISRGRPQISLIRGQVNEAASDQIHIIIGFADGLGDDPVWADNVLGPLVIGQNSELNL